MDLFKVIRELYEEKRRLDGVIKHLESMLDQTKQPLHIVKRRGRKSMSPDERREVSERMRRYWAQKKTDPPTGTNA